MVKSGIDRLLASASRFLLHRLCCSLKDQNDDLKLANRIDTTQDEPCRVNNSQFKKCNSFILYIFICTVQTHTIGNTEINVDEQPLGDPLCQRLHGQVLPPVVQLHLSALPPGVTKQCRDRGLSFYEHAQWSLYVEPCMHAQLYNKIKHVLSTLTNPFMSIQDLENNSSSSFGKAFGAPAGTPTSRSSSVVACSGRMGQTWQKIII